MACAGAKIGTLSCGCRGRKTRFRFIRRCALSRRRSRIYVCPSCFFFEITHRTNQGLTKFNFNLSSRDSIRNYDAPILFSPLSLKGGPRMPASKLFKYFVIVLAANLFFTFPLLSQVSGGNINGTVTDPNGGAIPHAEVSITNTDTGITRVVTTNSDGFYVAPNLSPGHYDVTVTAKDFTTQKRTGVVVTVGAQEALNLKLGLANISQKVEVTTEVASVELTTSDIGGLVGSTTVQQLPLNGRSWTDLTALQPGVKSIETQVSFTDSGRGNRGFGSQVAISGARPQQNNYRLDGVSLNDYANGAPSSVLGGSLGVDAIQEFSISTTNYSAEYGRSSGGVINAVPRSGT